MIEPAGLRLDQMLVARGLVPTRARARDLILRGFVKVQGETCLKPAQIVSEDVSIALKEDTPQWVSRGAEKLIAGLAANGFDVAGRMCVDAGASTGGFTQVLLARGAAKVYAFDTGHGQLHDDVRQDPRVIALERTDIRTINRSVVPDAIGVVVADLSFISLTKALTGVLALAESGAQLVALIKPQFELAPADVSRGGIVRKDEARARAVEQVRAFVEAQAGWRVTGVVPSPIEGGSGNVEFLLGAVKA